MKTENIRRSIENIKHPTKFHFMLGFFAVVAMLWGVKKLFVNSDTSHNTSDTMRAEANSSLFTLHSSLNTSHFHRIRGVANYKATFPDSQSVQIVAAEHWGVKPVKNREDAEHRKKELVYVGESPYYHVDRLSSSIPYLVPRASVLLNDIGQAFFDSLYAKGVPLNQLIVTSVLRSMDDVARLQRHNQNATDRSCHLFGTTFDICYNRYHPITQPVRDDTLKWILSEVLRDKRQEGRCYVKYEVKQGCFHMTVR
jgi:hypothetical protein